MKPTIYKPSIYKGAGIYKIGSEGGGGGGGGQEIYEFDVLGKTYKYIKLDKDLYWPLENLDYIDENINLGFTGYNDICAAYYNNDLSYKYNGLIYSRPAVVYIDSIKPPNTRFMNTNTDFDKLKNLIDNIFSPYVLSDLGYTNLLKNNTHNNNIWTINQNLFLFGIEPCGYITLSSKNFGGITYDAYFGISCSDYDTVFTCRNNSTLGFANGARYENAYTTRLLIDLN